MRIGIDCRMYGLEHAGIGRYIVNLLGEMKSLVRGDWEIVLLVRKKNLGEIRKKFADSFSVVISDFPHYSTQEQILLPFQLLRLKLDLVHFLHFNVPIFYLKPFVVTIHDLIKHYFRGGDTTTRAPLFYYPKYLGYRLVARQAIVQAKKIIVPSNFVKEEILSFYHLPVEKIEVVYEGGGFREQKRVLNSQLQKRILEKYRIKKPYLLYVGNVYPHKNLERLITAVGLISKFSLQLVIVSARSVFWERLKRKVQKMQAERWVNLVGFVPDEDLVALYKNAQAFVFPSLSEGFGLPGLEAMSCGCPVLCSDIPVFHEIYQKAALYFNPLDSADIARKILHLLSFNSADYYKLVRKGLKQARRYSWRKMAEEILEIYRKVLSRQRSKFKEDKPMIIEKSGEKR